jgi:hypothetical protein
MANGLSGKKVIISRFTAGAEPQQRVTSARVDEVVRAIVELGGTYPDVVQVLQQSKKEGALASRFEVDALPQPGRAYDRHATDFSADDTEASEFDEPAVSREAPFEVATPLPDLFTQQR